MEDKEILVSCENLSKRFCRDLKRSFFYGLGDMGIDLMMSRKQGSFGTSGDLSLRKGEFWALKDISFELRRGECLGLVGHNGAGKTTLLKILNGLIKPDSGYVKMRGKVGALIALGAGFNPLLTGRENIFINGALLGLSRNDIKLRLDEIITFAGIEEFIDSPVRNYSSGMRVKLGFSIAVNMDPDILLVDEVLAVGDVGFRNKCYNTINRLIDQSAVILVSHSITQVAKICNCGLLLDHGTTKGKDNEIAQVVDNYVGGFDEQSPVYISGSGKAKVKKLKLVNALTGDEAVYSDTDSSTVKSGMILSHAQSIRIELDVDSFESERFHVSVAFYDSEKKRVAQISSLNQSVEFQKNNVVLYLESLLLSRGLYTIHVHIRQSVKGLAGEMLASVRDIMQFQVSASGVEHGTAPVEFLGDWRDS
jgi:lipopolysaccharide transport system ATP-binding protein